MKECREIEGEERRGYLEEGLRKKKNQLELLGSFRLRSETKANRYWLKDEDRKCRLCKELEETLKDIAEDCKYTGDKNTDWKEVLKDDGKKIAILQGIRWKRKRMEMEKEKDGTEQ